MDQLIPLVNKLQDVFNTLGRDPINLPQIVVIGSQSSGKSSVLENIVGRDFLPRGSGIVTRRPLILQLIRLSPGSNGKPLEEWGEFLHTGEKIFTDFQEIKREIASETDRLTGQNKGISNLPINLKIYSPNVVDLTLVDLPGTTRVPVGDQPKNVEHQIREMVLSYISRPTTIILAVTAANTDAATSDALSLARQVDEFGKRTIGVITKLDLMDKGTDAMSLLMGKVIPLRLGFVGVINRSQQDITGNVSIREALDEEKKFFETHSIYSTLKDRVGCKYLSSKLNKILVEHIRHCLPDLKTNVAKMLEETQKEFTLIGGDSSDELSDKGRIILQVVTEFSSSFKEAIEGDANLKLNELYGGARVSYIFRDIFGKYLDEINPLHDLSQETIRTAIRNSAGARSPLFVPEMSFELLLKRQISKLEEPSLQCLEHVYDELHRVVQQLENRDLVRFARLRERVVYIVNQLLQQLREPARKMISDLVAIERSYINSNHPDFLGSRAAIKMMVDSLQDDQNVDHKSTRKNSKARRYKPSENSSDTSYGNKRKESTPVRSDLNHPETPSEKETQSQGNPRGFYGLFFKKGDHSSPAPQQPSPAPPRPSHSAPPQPNPPPEDSPYNPFTDKIYIETAERLEATEKERFEIQLIEVLLVNYFKIVRQNIQDSVPKVIMHFLVNATIQSLQNELVRSLYKEDLFAELLEENPLVAQQREKCRKILSSLQRAKQLISEVREISLVG